MADLDTLFKELAALSPEEAQELSDLLKAKMPKKESATESSEDSGEA